MEVLLVLSVIVVGLALFGGLSVRFGIDSTDGSSHSGHTILA
jgi:hypothetical protein